ESEPMLSAPSTPLPSLALLPEAAVMLSARGHVLEASATAVEMFRSELVGCELDALLADPSRLYAATEGLETGAHVPLVPLEGRRADGVPFALDASVRVLDAG